MRLIISTALTLFVLGSAVWAYQQNYHARVLLDEKRSLEREIAQLHAKEAILQAEWAYQNRPERLKKLADIAFSELGLLPLQPEQFVSIREVPFYREPTENERAYLPEHHALLEAAQ